MSDTSIVPFDAGRASQLALAFKQLIVQMMTDKVLVEGVHYGTIPGTGKPTLFKPGAEYLASAHKLHNTFAPLTVIEDWEHGFFFYRYECRFMHRETGELYGTGIGSCNSMEAKYRWRWVSEEQIPAGFDIAELESRNTRKTLSEFGFAIDKAETSGQYGKPAEHWQMFKQAIANGTAKEVTKQTKRGDSLAYEITTGATLYRIPNTEVYDLVNTLDKMAQKRALIAAALIATNASEFFTQDLEDFAQNMVITVSDDIPVKTVDDDLGTLVVKLTTANNATPRAANQANDRQAASAPKTPQTGAQSENSGTDAPTLKSDVIRNFDVRVADNGQHYIVAGGMSFFSAELFRQAGFKMSTKDMPRGAYDFKPPVVIRYTEDEDGYPTPVKVEKVK